MRTHSRWMGMGLAALVAGLGLAAGGWALAQDAPHDHAAPPPDATADAPATQPAAYPLTTCPVKDGKLDKDAVILQYEGREVRFCCQDCVAVFKKDPAKYLAKMDKQIVAQQLPTYPLETCVVSGDKLGGDMGEAINYVYQNRLVRFCCSGCIKPFKKEPAKYLALIDEAAKKKAAK